MFLVQEYQKALEDADEKVQLANQIYELVICVLCKSCINTYFASLSAFH
jgi:hypothetical protein